MSERDFHLYLSEILESGEAVKTYVRGFNLTTFCNDRKTYSAVIREFEIIGEAVGKLPDEIKSQYPNVSWQDIKDFRNILIHEYFGVDLEIVWQVIQDELTPLMEATNAILSKGEVEK